MDYEKWDCENRKTARLRRRGKVTGRDKIVLLLN
jgi:hypothetical protein